SNLRFVIPPPRSPPDWIKSEKPPPSTPFLALSIRILLISEASIIWPLLRVASLMKGYCLITFSSLISLLILKTSKLKVVNDFIAILSVAKELAEEMIANVKIIFFIITVAPHFPCTVGTYLRLKQYML